MRTFLLIIAVVYLAGAAVTIDRIAVAVDRHPIKTSDIDRDIRLTAFLNRASLTASASEKKASEERLVDQQIIRGELASGAYRRATDQDADALLQQIRHDRFGNSDARLNQELARYGLTRDELRSQLLWQLTVLRFINERFRAAVLVSDEDIQKYYDAHRAEFNAPLQAVAQTIRTLLEGEQVNREFEDWLARQRKRADIEYKTEAP